MISHGKIAMRPSRRRIVEGLSALGMAAAASALAQPALPPPVSSTPAEPQIEGGDDPSRATTARNDALQIVTAVSLNGKGPYKFLVDTGANRSCIAQSLVPRLGLPLGEDVAVHSMAGVRIRRSVVLDRLEVAGKTQRRVRAPVLPLSGSHFDGVLGIDWLKGRRLVLGFKDQSLEITKPVAETSGEGRVVVPARRRSGQLTMVDADVSGQKISAMIDTGSQATVGNAALRRALPARKPTDQDRAERVQLASVTGETFYGDLVYVPFLRLGGLTLGNVPVVFTEAHVFKLWELTDTPALILGMDLLSQFSSVALDFGRSTVRFDFANKPGEKAF